MLIHLVDVSGSSGRDPVEDFDTIIEELRLFDPQVAAKPQIVAANKIDALDDPSRLERLERHVRALELPFHRISGATGEGVDELLEAAWRQIAAVRAAAAETELAARETVMRRLGVLGGTFDPIHYGHLDAAHAARQALALDEILFVPAHDQPHRTGDPRATAFHRFAMVALAIDGCPGYRVSDVELRARRHVVHHRHAARAARRGLGRVADFLHPRRDAFAEIATWRGFPDVLDAAHFAVVARPGRRSSAAVALRGATPGPAVACLSG